MPAVEEHSYRFRTADHWQAGARRELQLRGDRLVVPDQLAVRPIPGTGVVDGGGLPAVDGCGHLVWLRPGPREFVRRLPREGAVAVLGVLDGLTPARRLVVGRSVVWVLAENGLDRYAATTLQRLTPSGLETGWRLSDAAGDGTDGLWITEVHRAAGWRLRHVDCWGRTCRDPVVLEGVDAEDLSVTPSEAGDRIVAVDPAESTELFVLDTSTGTLQRTALDAVHHGGRTLLATGAGQLVHLLTVLDATGHDGVTAVHQAVDPASGDVEGHQVLQVPRALGRPTALIGRGPDLVLACSRGIAELDSLPAAGEIRRAVFITPALVSPIGSRAGWDRAEVDILLPAGTTMELTWAATDEIWLADQAAQLLAGTSTPGVVDELERLLPWQPRGTTYRGADGPAARLAALLDRVEETTLWLRIELRVPAGGSAPELAGLRVRYPDTSYLDHLPAIYRENPRAEEDLRAILAPYEVLLDGIDETLDSLPGRLDPATADDDWTDYLLGWLGFPPLGELPARVRRHLLEQASELLDLRGTREGLERLLDLVTGGRATVTDSSEDPAGWFLGATGTPSAPDGLSRLGIDTVALGRLPRPARAGALVVGASRLGHTCADPQAMLAQRARTVTITLHVGRDHRVLRSVLARLLDTFVPAHCRVQVRWSGEETTRGRRLDVDLRLASEPSSGSPEASCADSLLADDTRWRLGETTHLGRWPLPRPTYPPAVLDHRARLGTGPRVQ